MSSIPYYPVHLKVKGKTCLVVGGGKVGMRKARTLAKSGALVKMVSPRLMDTIPRETADRISWISEPYTPEHIVGTTLVFAATDQRQLNRQIAADARSKGILCNIADDPDASDFILPAIVHRGDLILTVSTSGNSPAFAKKLRQDLEARFGEEYADFLLLMGKIRSRLLAQGHAPDRHKAIFSTLINEDLLGMIMENQTDKINHLLLSILGSGYTYENLMPGDPT
ncbi:precorrin-2 dehydrogenase / sirohydrochlorin ferrochelatase [Desulfocicer vacuolatum DSM 3385]|uniref:precorrin-2 dehydrogenase n=1 Tax=Desulfocicer vacuolatum DSM 3385 TaxID=1121400 RepID=A0A1W2E4H0_9BACT|nr:bifunctional precorrin-2 dehydrogenase/sirohydrochlorin ferrochelatase [Desulfocicer vacuolatum]SMD04683.1 precorrin-2 dehydrogenase / sirohydrochlorin ferrochelatase [Desulfocicer vacuolatum DSM 3385]